MSFYDPSPLRGMLIVPESVVKQQQKETISKIEILFHQIQKHLSRENLKKVSLKTPKNFRNIPLSPEKAKLHLLISSEKHIQKETSKKS